MKLANGTRVKILEVTDIVIRFMNMSDGTGKGNPSRRK